jgi:hypothetical protein
MDLEHHVVLLPYDMELHLAPVRNPTRILDLGTWK